MPDAATLLKEASVTAKKLTSVHMALSVVGKVPEMPVEALKGDLTNEPETAGKGTAKIMMFGSEVDIYFVVSGDHLYASLPGDPWRDYGPTAKVYDPTTVLHPDDGLANTLANFIDPTVETRETIGGQQTIRITGKVTADAVNKLVPQLDATKRMPCTVWIQEGGDHQAVEVELKPTKDDSVQMVFSDWNVPVSVAKPPVA